MLPIKRKLEVYVMVRAEEIMVKDVAVVHPDDVVTDVVGLFVERNVTSAVVVDEKNTVKGIITDGDIMAAIRRRRPLVVDFFNFIWAAGDEVDLAVKAEALSTMKVKDLMTKQVITVGEATEILEIARLMAEHKIKQIPVVQGNFLVGLVRRYDIVKAVAWQVNRLQNDTE
jgi:CBS domain-containing protein